MVDIYSHPKIYAGDFNSHHTAWKYPTTEENGDHLANWADSHNLSLIFDANERATFKSASALYQKMTKSARFKSVGKFQRILRHSQHRPIVLKIGVKIPVICSTTRPRLVQWDN